MSTETKSRAAQRNGAKSRGPVTPEGKRKSAANSSRHGLLAKTVVLENERLEVFNGLLATLVREFNPQSEVQRSLVETMAIARWRLMRIWAIERATFDTAIEKHDPDTHDPADCAALAFRGLADESRTLDLLHRYEVRYDRQFSRALSLFMKLADPNNPRTQFCQTNPSAGLTAIDSDVVPDSAVAASPEIANQPTASGLAERQPAPSPSAHSTQPGAIAHFPTFLLANDCALGAPGTVERVVSTSVSPSHPVSAVIPAAA